MSPCPEYLRCFVIQYTRLGLSLKPDVKICNNLTELQLRGGTEDNSTIFYYFSTKSYIVTPQQNRLEAVLMIGHKICFFLLEKCGLQSLNQSFLSGVLIKTWVINLFCDFFLLPQWGATLEGSKEHILSFTNTPICKGHVFCESTQKVGKNCFPS